MGAVLLVDPVYPAVENSVSTDETGRATVHLRTLVRLRSDNDGLWYLHEVSSSTRLCDCFDVIRGIMNAMNAFHGKVYRDVICGKVDLNSVHYRTKEPFYKLDQYCQRDETERLSGYI